MVFPLKKFLNLLKINMKHDDIVLGLTDKILIDLLSYKSGVLGNWSNYHWVVNQEIIKWDIGQIKMLNKSLGCKFEYKDLEILKARYTKNYKITDQCKNINKGLFIEKTFEYPLIKGEGQYKCTKGFIDLIVHTRPSSGLFNNFNTYSPQIFNEFVIEIKKESDFKDFGSILRQIKEYKEYYLHSCKRWDSNLKKGISFALHNE